ncbi:DNA-processing protein DprA [Maricaulis virginensis]|uniref:DNA processing protein DprA n=1 Tax=Maricaulis virginensis TaxID=144022 RepID=A0A9W6IIJ6_9PROT|nr:DNA-processing protein DprA [Maricaulis virginensis]GLK50987.1 DNA processing protein DprA [Maricaulis virginensis]
MSEAGPGHAERVMWLRLARTEGLGAVGFARLIARYVTAEAALDALPGRCRKAGKPAPVIPSRETIEAELDAVDRIGGVILTGIDPGFPPLLAAIPAPPPALVVKGDLALLDRPACAMVGARNASAAGLRFARELAHGLGGEGIVVVSGLARGIDGAAHAGALETGTIAVVAGGIDHIYPPEHADLHNAIAERGLVVSERSLGRIPTARDFPRRNRLISGLSRGTVVVEAALRSGSLITARFAAEQGREVMAVPGSPIDPRARGSNQLLRDGAHLIETVEDVTGILAGLQSLPQVREAAPQSGDDLFDEDWPDTPVDEAADAGNDDISGTSRIRGLVSPTPVSVDEIARQSGLPAGTVSAMLMELELTGEVARLPGGLVQRVTATR